MHMFNRILFFFGIYHGKPTEAAPFFRCHSWDDESPRDWYPNGKRHVYS